MVEASRPTPIRAAFSVTVVMEESSVDSRMPVVVRPVTKGAYQKAERSKRSLGTHSDG